MYGSSKRDEGIGEMSSDEVCMDRGCMGLGDMG